MTRSRAIVASVFSGSNAGKIAFVPPMYSSGRVCTPRPPMWNIGATVTVRSRLAEPAPRAEALIAFHRRLSWVSIAPLGRPVVPDVYMRQAHVASGHVDAERPRLAAREHLFEVRLAVGGLAADHHSGAHPDALAGKRGAGEQRTGDPTTRRRRRRNRPTGRSPRAAASLKLMGTKTAPSLAVANIVSRKAALLTSKAATRSPCRTPSLAQCPGELVCAPVELGVGDATVPVDQRDTVSGEKGPSGGPAADPTVHLLRLHSLCWIRECPARRESRRSVARVTESGWELTITSTTCRVWQAALARTEREVGDDRRGAGTAPGDRPGAADPGRPPAGRSGDVRGARVRRRADRPRGRAGRCLARHLLHLVRLQGVAAAGDRRGRGRGRLRRHRPWAIGSRRTPRTRGSRPPTGCISSPSPGTPGSCGSWIPWPTPGRSSGGCGSTSVRASCAAAWRASCGCRSWDWPTGPCRPAPPPARWGRWWSRCAHLWQDPVEDLDEDAAVEVLTRLWAGAIGLPRSRYGPTAGARTELRHGRPGGPPLLQQSGNALPGLGGPEPLRGDRRHAAEVILQIRPGQVPQQPLGDGERFRRPLAELGDDSATVVSRSSSGTAQSGGRPACCARTPSKGSPVRKSSQGRAGIHPPQARDRDDGRRHPDADLAEPERRRHQAHREVAGRDQAQDHQP